MKFTVAALLTALITTCSAQGIVVSTPDRGANVPSNLPVVIQLEVTPPGGTLTITELVLVIGMFSGSPSQLGQELGTIIVNNSPLTSQSPPQFSANISTFRKGPATLSFLHVSMVGPNNTAFWEVLYVPVNLV